MNAPSSIESGHLAPQRAAEVRPRFIGCLAPWQAKRLRLYIEANLPHRLNIGTLADVVNVSSGHLCHAFKRTFGTTVHTYVMHRRVERARHLLLNTSTELSDIALSCGLSDQSHLTRWFRRVCGETPGAFRRARYEPPAGLTQTSTPLLASPHPTASLAGPVG
ncbi:MAG TPA: AraC family transcriptional regulator [Steroidobacteraceae bacterium]